MSDVWLWRALEAPIQDPDAVAAALEALSGMPLADRGPIWGRLAGVVEHESSRLRAASLAVLAGATGREGWRAMVRGLDDPAAEVRAAALASLRISAVQDPARWAHALFHPSAEVRREAVARRPHGVPSTWLLHLLADEETASGVRERIAELVGSSGEPVELLLDFHRAGVLSAEEARLALAQLSWERQPALYLALSAAGEVHREADSLAEVSSVLEHAGLRDRLDELVELFWETDHGLFARIGSGFRATRFPRGLRLRIAWSVLRVGRRLGRWDADALRLAVVALPPVVLDETLAIDDRKRAAAGAGAFAPPSGDGRVPLEAVLSAPVGRTADGAPDLRVLAGLLSLAPEDGWSCLEGRLGVPGLLAAVEADPAAAVDLLAVPTPRRLGAFVDRLLLGMAGLEAPWVPAALTRVVLSLPSERLGFVDRIAAGAPERLFEMVRALGRLDIGDAVRLTERARARAARCFGQVLASRGLLSAALGHLVAWPETGSSPALLEVMAETLRHYPERALKRTLTALDGDDLEAALPLFDAATTLPWTKLESMARTLRRHGRPPVARWADGVLTPPAPVERGPRAPPNLGAARALGRIQSRRIRTARDADLPAALRICFSRSVHGLVAALGRRPPPWTPDAEVCAALLVCHDPPDEVAPLFDRYCDGSDEQLRALDRLLVERCAHSAGLPWLAGAWLFRWERPLSSLGAAMVRPPATLGTTVVASLRWESRALRERLWQALARLVTVWRYREPQTLRRHADAELARLLIEQLPRMGVPAARMLVQLTEAVLEPATSSLLAEEVRHRLGDLDAETLEALGRWLDTSGAAPRTAEVAPPPPESEESLRARIGALRAPEDVAPMCAASDERTVRLALERLEGFGPAGRAALTAVLAPPTRVHHPRRIAAALASWSLDEQRAAIEAVAVPGGEPELRFHLAAVLLQSAPGEALPHLTESVVVSGERQWLRREDRELILRGGVEERTLCLATVASPQLCAYAPAVTWLVAHASEASVRDALRTFLEVPGARLASSRLQAAAALKNQRDFTGFPVLVGHALFRRSRGEPEFPPSELCVEAPPDQVEAAGRVAEVAGDAVVPEALALEALEADGVDESASDAARVGLLHASSVAATHHRILSSLRPRASRHAKLQRLARTFAWGVREGRSLTGRLFRIRMIGGDALGYTRLGSSAVQISPLPLLRGERDGEAVVRGLILHELGHHLYHGGRAGLDVWDEAARERLDRLLNLVADEHLERNLRAGEEAHGNDLKTLAAYAFQHANRDVDVAHLLASLGPHAFGALSQTRLSVARHRGCVRIGVGGVLRSLEGAGSSFARFMRALRMGLGDRFGDPRVAEGLTLFRGAAFRSSTMPELLRIARELHRIFGDEIRLLETFDEHVVLSGEDADLRSHGEGITDEELQKAVDRILDPRQETPHESDEPPRRELNLGESTDFDRIATVVPVTPDPDRHRALVARVARPARQMRRFFERLGLQLVPMRMRMRGRALDRSRIPAVVLRRDPRMLIAREPVRRTDLFLGVVVDCSGSMAMGENIERARLFGTLLSEAARGLRGIDAHFWGFTDSEILDAGTAERSAVSGLEADGGNNDAAALWHAAGAAMRSRRRAKLLVMVSDGAPTECTVEALRGLVDELGRRRGICCAQVAVRPLDEICFPHYVEIDDGDLDEAVRRFGRVVARLVGGVIGGG